MGYNVNMDPFTLFIGVLLGVGLAILMVWIEEKRCRRKRPGPPDGPDDDDTAVTVEITAGPVREQAIDPNEEADR
jgi:hypothetical protein